LRKYQDLLLKVKGIKDKSKYGKSFAWNNLYYIDLLSYYCWFICYVTDNIEK